MLVFFLQTPPPPLSLCLPLSHISPVPISVCGTQTVIKLFFLFVLLNVVKAYCLLSICSKLEEAAELLPYIDSNNVYFLILVIKEWF